MPSRMHLRLLTPAVPARDSTQDDDVSSYYRSISRLEALRIVADAAHLPLLIFFALFFAAGMYVGRWSVVFETRQRRKHLAEAVAGVVDGVLAGTSKGTNPGATTDDDEMTTAVIEGVLEGLRAGGAASTGGDKDKGPASSFANRGTNQSKEPRPAPSTSDAAGSSARRGRSKRSSADPLDDVLSRELRAAEAEAAATKRKIDAADVDGAAEDAGENEAPIDDDEARPSSEPEPIGDVEMMDAATPSASSVGTRSRRTPVKDNDAAAAEPKEEPELPEEDGDEEDVVSSRLAPDPPPVESPTRTHAREAEWSSRQAEIERQRAESTRLKKAAKSARLVNERVETYRRGLEEREALESAMGDARAEAQRSFERDGVHDLAAAGCLEHVLHRLGLLPNPDENRDVGKVEVAFKKALARNHPDRSASRGDDVRAGARCEEAFKLLQAAKARWDAAGKPVGPSASQTAASVLGVSTHYGYPQQQQQPQSSSRSTFTSPHTQQKGRSWQPGGHTQTPGASVPGAGGFDSNYNDAWREQAKRTAAATADALRREEERMRLELEERERLEREREAREAFERKLRDLSRKTSGGDETGAWVQGSDASEEGTPRHPDAMNGKDDRKKRPPPNDFQ